MRGLGCLLVLLLGVVLGGFAFMQLGQRPAGIASAPTVPVSTAAAVRFDQKVATLARADTPVTVEITDEEATSKVAAMLAADPSAPRVDNPQVAFRAGKVYVSGTTADTPVPIAFLAVGRVEARDGRLVAVVEDIDTGRVPLPGAVRDQIAQGAANLDSLNATLPIYVTEVRVLDGRLALTGRPRRAALPRAAQIW
ncbi:MAG TPA: hypothetical protein VFW96_03775 [Thermomicrobiales bacterium]|nr:hypothetical protein [Thermomicrobiales bacterium]